MDNEQTMNDSRVEEQQDVAQEQNTVAEKEQAADNAPVSHAEIASAPVKEKKVSSTAKRGKGMSKTFKLVYFPVMALLALVMLVFSIVDAACGYKPTAKPAEYYDRVNNLISALAADSRSDYAASGTTETADAIFDALTASGVFKQIDEVKEGEEDENEKVTTVTTWVGVEPTVTKMTAYPSGELMAGKNAPVYAGGQLTNVIAAIPSRKTYAGEESNALIITVRYDSRNDTFGAGDNAAFVANAVQTLIDYAKVNSSDSTRFDNDIIVVFTEDLDYSYGSYAFFDAFKGFDNVVSRAQYGLNLDSFGNAGTLAVTDTSNAGHAYFSAVSKVTGSAYNSSIVPAIIPQNMKRTGAVDAFGDIPAIQISVLGGLENAQSEYDSAENLSSAIVYQQAALLKNYIEKFGNLDKTYSAENDGYAYVSYLDWSTISYNNVASYVMGGIAVALIAAVIAVLAVKKYFPLGKLFAAFGAELSVIAGSLAITVASYFLLALLLTSFGVIPIHAIVTVRSFNVGVLIAAMLIGLASAFGLTAVCKKLFKVTSSDVVRGTALVFGVVGAIVCFAAPAYSVATSILGILMLVVLLATVCLNGKFKARFGFGFDRLFVYVWPVLICLPLVMSTLTVVYALSAMWMLPIVLTLFVGLLGTAVPYLDRTAPIFDKLAKKLPPRTLRVETTRIERVEDRAKKGKFTEKEVTVIEKQKFPVNYKNYFGVSVIAVLGVVIAIFTGSFGNAAFGKNVVEPYNYDNAIYNDALVYEWTKNGSTVTKQLVVDDLMTYKYLRYAIDGLEWDGTRYTKAYTAQNSIVSGDVGVYKNGDSYTVTTFGKSHSYVTITIPSARSVTKITITDDNETTNEYVYEFRNNDTIELKLPYGFGDFEFTVEGTQPTTVNYEEHCMVGATGWLDDVTDWINANDYFADTVYAQSLRGAIVVKVNGIQQ